MLSRDGDERAGWWGERTNLGEGGDTPQLLQVFFKFNMAVQHNCRHFSKICKPVLLPTRQVVDFSLKEIKYLWRFAYLSLSAANSNTVSASRTTAAWPGWLLFRKSLALETVLDTLLLILKFHLPPIETNQYLINLLVLNFAGISMISQFWQDNISLGFIFTISLGKLIWKKGTKFCNSRVLNLILHVVFNLLNFLKYRDEMKQAKHILMFFHDRKHSHWMESTSKAVPGF